MAFLLAEKEARKQEKEEEKIARSKERKEDMEEIKAMIQAGVKQEVQVAVIPLQERLDLQEKNNRELKEQFSEVLEEVKTLRESVKTSEEFPFLPKSQNLKSIYASKHIQLNSKADHDHVRQVEELCASARKVIGLTPIEPRMLELQIQSFGAKDQEQAMQMEVESYLKCEMKMKPTDIQRLDIVRVFPPPGQDDWKTLFVEFGSEFQVDKVFQHTKYMVKSDHRVLHWFPVQMKERRAAIEKIAFEIREAGRVDKIRTRVRVGREDIQLSTKLPNEKWKRELLPPDLPEIDFSFTSSPAPTSSPPPGRPGRDHSRKRPKSSDDEVDDASKKQKGDEKDISEEKNIGEQDQNVSLSVTDTGRFTGLEAYSPLSPAKTKSIPDLSVLVNSPVFHSKQGKK